MIKFLLFLFLLISCSKNAIQLKNSPVENFDVKRYSGKWYEIARKDRWFEKGCKNSTAEYIIRDGYIEVLNKCYVDGKEKSSRGKAYFSSDKNIGNLRVSFFWLIKGVYNINYLDTDYKYSIVDGGNNENLWILSRTKKINKKELVNLLDIIKSKGFTIDDLIFNENILL